MLDAVEVSSWRWERQGDYSAIDSELLTRWRRGLGRDPSADRPWQEYIQRTRAKGAMFERVRMLTDPLTEYLRCQLDVTYMNVDAGEDIRWVEQQHAERLGLPEYDYYLIDGVLVASLEFGADGLLSQVHTSVDEEVVERHRRWRDVIWPYAVPHERYLTDHA